MQQSKPKFDVTNATIQVVLDDGESASCTGTVLITVGGDADRVGTFDLLAGWDEGLPRGSDPLTPVPVSGVEVRAIEVSELLRFYLEHRAAGLK